MNKPMHRPFGNLDALIKRRKIKLAAFNDSSKPTTPSQPVDPQEEARLFAEAMADVIPLRSNRHWCFPAGRPERADSEVDDDVWTCKALKKLVEEGRGFNVSHTSEYMEVRGPGVAPEVVRRLRRGFYAIQDHVDLHGLGVVEAQQVLHRFVRQAISKGLHGLLVVHGRGLTSPHKPVLKHKVFEWLTRGPLRNHVVAMASARMCDGGAGATYVLLRDRPLTRRQRKNNFLVDIQFQTH
jgi:DNA-nicking Smr family endonuclease